MSSIRSSGPRVVPLFKDFTEAAAGTTTKRFSVAGAKSVVIIARAASGTPTLTIGYQNFNGARSTTPADFLLEEDSAGTLTGAGGLVTYINPNMSTINFATYSPMAVMNMDLRVAGNVTGLDAIAIVAY